MNFEESILIYILLIYRVHSLVSARQMDKQAVTQLERRVQDERRLRSSSEAQLSAERKAKEAATRALSSPPSK